jgi:hypothetical protein
VKVEVRQRGLQNKRGLLTMLAQLGKDEGLASLKLEAAKQKKSNEKMTKKASTMGQVVPGNVNAAMLIKAWMKSDFKSRFDDQSKAVRRRFTQFLLDSL